MDRVVAKQTLQSVVNFLRSELTGGQLDSESAESVEVAVQCLETAYSLPCDTQPILDLQTLYSEALASSDAMGSQQSANVSSQPVSEEDKLEGEKLKSQGNEYMGMESYDLSVECYTKAIEKDPRNAVYYCNRAAAYSKLNKHELAVADCKKALTIQPNYSKAYGRMGLAYASMNMHLEAQQSYTKALELEPENPGFVRNLSISTQALQGADAPPSNPFASLLNPAAAGGADIQNLMSNPNLMSMASTFMSDPNVQNMMAGLFGGANPTAAAPTPGGAPAPAPGEVPTPSAPQGGNAPAQAPGIEALFSAGRQLAEQMQSQHPDLIEQLRTQMGDGAPRNNNNNSSGDQQP